MKTNRVTAGIFALFLAVGIGVTVFFPKEKKWNRQAEIRVGAGDDISGLLMEETVRNLSGKYEISKALESSSFQDCCSNTAQWAMNAKEINVAFYCTHIAKHTIENNPDVEIYGPVIMNGETILYTEEWENVRKVGVTQGREQSKALAGKTYPQIEGFNEITQKGILYAMEDGQVDAAILDITKAAKIPEFADMPLSDSDYISYVLVADKEFAKTQAFRDFVKACNQASEHLREPSYLAGLLGVEEAWVADKNVKFLKLEETGEN